MKKYIVLFVFLAAILIVVATSQKTTDRHHIRLGNRHFGKSQFDKQVTREQPGGLQHGMRDDGH